MLIRHGELFILIFTFFSYQKLEEFEALLGAYASQMLEELAKVLGLI